MKKKVMEKRSPERYLLFLFLAILAFELCMIFYINLFHNQNHIGYDAASLMLRAMEMWTQKTLFPPFYEQSTLMLDASALPAALLYGIIGDIFISFGIVNCIITIAIGAVSYALLYKHAGLKPLYIVILLCVFFCNFMNGYAPVNPIGNLLPCLWVSSSFYSVKLLYMLLSIYVFLSLWVDTRIGSTLKVCAILTILLSFLTGLSSGAWALATLWVPLGICLIFKAINEQKLMLLLNRPALFLIVCVGAVMGGLLYCKLAVGFSPRSELTLTGWDNFIQNIYNIYGGYLLLFSGMGYETNLNALSPQGIVTLVCFTAANIFLVVFIWVIKNKLFRNQYLLVNVIMCIVLFNIFLYAICHFTYGSPVFEQRYMIFQVFPMLLTLPIALSNISHATFKRLGFGILSTILLLANIGGYTSYFLRDISSYNEAVPKAVARYDVGLVYGTDDVMNRNLRVLDYGRIYHTLSISDIGTVSFPHWGDYKHYEEVSEYGGDTLLIASPSKYETIPANIRSKYIFQENISDNPDWGLYYAKGNWFDEETNLPENGTITNFPWSAGMSNQNNIDIDERGWITNGMEGYALYGPFSPVKTGAYNFTLYYEILDAKNVDNPGTFDICTDEEVLASAPLFTGQNIMTLSNVSFSSYNARWQHRVFVNAGMQIRIDKIEITKVS